MKKTSAVRRGKNRKGSSFRAINLLQIGDKIMASLVFSTQIPESKRIGGHINASFSAGLITDALVAANATVTALKAAILTGAVKTVQRPMAQVLNKALDRGVSLSQIPETHSQTTVAGLVGLTDASSTFKQSFLG